MREALEMVTASRMQNMVQVRKKNVYFMTKILLELYEKSSFGAIGVESPHGGAIKIVRFTQVFSFIVFISSHFISTVA